MLFKLRVRNHDEIDIPRYKEYDCLQKFMAFRVFQKCNCYPDYIDSIYNWMNELGLNNLERFQISKLSKLRLAFSLFPDMLYLLPWW